jgi:hypothetical protein
MRLRLQPLAALSLAIFLLTGCGSSHKSGSKQAPERIWTTAPVSPGNQTPLVKSFNVYLANRKGPASPGGLAFEFVRLDRTQAAQVNTTTRSSAEGGGPTTVIVVQDGLADDSVRATRDVLRFVPFGNSWRLKSAVRTQRCQLGRGHQSFALGDCL